MAPTAQQFVTLALRQRGDRYVFGVEDRVDDPDPEAFDCSELVEWDAHRLGLTGVPDGSYNQYPYCRKRGLAVPIAQAIKTQGALLFAGDPIHHVAISLGNGWTIEARGRAYGVNTFPATGRSWTVAALLPGLDYNRPKEPAPPKLRYPAFPGRLLLPGMTGADWKTFAARMRARGWHGIGPDARYDADEEGDVRAFQREKHLAVDGIVGPDTWRTAWVAPITR